MESSTLEKITSNQFVKVFLSVLAIITGAITIYLFVQENNIELQYEIVANTNVLDINADLSKLDILYDSTSLKQRNESLRIITLKVVNNGEKDILKTFYDTNAPLGIRVKGGKIIEKPELINASNDYLKSNISIANYLPEKVNFPQVILESGEYFTIKLLLLHHVNVTPQLMPIGKIAGQNEIKVINTTDPVQNKSFWVEAFEGNIWIHLARSVAYFLAILVLIILLIIFSIQVSEYKEKKRKKRRIKEFKARESFEYNKMDDAIFDRYKANGISNFKRMIYFTEDEEKLNDRYQEILEDLQDKDRVPNEDPIHGISNGRVIYEPNKDLRDWSIINNMIKDGILIKNGKDLSVNQPLKKTLEEFVSYLEEKEEFKKIASSSGRIIKTTQAEKET